MILKHHKTLTTQKWAQYPLFKQLLMISNELNRAKHWISKNDPVETGLCYERALELLYLTISISGGRGLLRELCRLKEFTAYLYSLDSPSLEMTEKTCAITTSLSSESFNLLNR